MAVMDRVRQAVSPDPDKLPDDFLAKIDHGRENLQRTAPKRDEAWEFVRGNHFAYVADNNKLSFLSPGSIGIKRKGKPAHRSRQARSILFDIVRREVSNASQQVPSYQVVPSTSDPEDVSAASLAEKILLYGYQRWELRRSTVDAVMHAVVGGEAFAWAYFDNSIGPFVGGPEDAIGTGDVRVRIYGGNECYWVPGLRFHESPWHVVEQAVEPDYVKNLPGFLGGSLTPDAQTRALTGRSNEKGKLILLSHWLERPCPQYPEGRWITIANKRRVLPDRPYPGTGEEPVLRHLVYVPDPDSDRAMGLVPNLLDPQRTLDDAENKAVEWKNATLFPQWAVQPGLMKEQPRTDEPLKIYEIPDPERNLKIIQPPPIPDGLFTMGDRAMDQMLRIAGQSDPPAGADSGKAVQTWVEKNRAASAMFISNLAEWHANVAHDCLVQAQQNYTEERVIKFRGDFGWESIQDFQGAQLRDQTDVRVFADSIEPQTKQAKDQRILNYAQMGAISPNDAMTAIETGATEGLIRTFAQQEARVGRIIRNLKLGPQALAQMPTLPTGRLEKVPQTDPMGQPVYDELGNPVMVDGPNPEMAPAWMPRYSDDLKIFRTMFEDWLTSEDYEECAPEIQDAANNIYGAILRLSAEKDAEQAAAQQQQAEQLGMANATRPPSKPNPSLPGLENA